MSYGLQVFSQSGRELLDTSKGAMLILDVLELPVLSWSKSYPDLAGQLIDYHIMRPLVFDNTAWPIVTITYPSGIPTVVITKTAGLDGALWCILIILRASNTAVPSYGLQVLSDVDNAQIISPDTESLRYLGSLAPDSSTVVSGFQYNYYQIDGNVPGSLTYMSNIHPVIFVELSTTHYSAIAAFDDLSAPSMAPPYHRWFIRTTSQIGFAPKIYVFLPDVSQQMITDNDYGLVVYNTDGSAAFHSGRDYQLLQTVGWIPISAPTPWGSNSYTPTIPLPLTCATNHLGYKGYDGGGAWETWAKLDGTGGVTIAWHHLGNGSGSVPRPDGPIAFINTANY